MGTYALLVTFSNIQSIVPNKNPNVRASVSLSATLLGCLVCVICNSKSFYSFLLKLCIIIVHQLKMCIFNFVHILNIFSILGVLNSDIFPSKMFRWCLICVISNANSFNVFIFKLCIVIVYRFKMCTTFFVQI